jgi:hypothetical protein
MNDRYIMEGKDDVGRALTRLIYAVVDQRTAPLLKRIELLEGNQSTGKEKSQ